MDYSQEIYLNPIWNFSEYLDNEFLTDCVVVCDGQEIKAHILVLANSSKYFYDMFTGEMQESITRRAEVTHNKKGLLPRVIRWMYTGKISYSFDEIMPLFSIARFYAIPVLKRDIENEISKKVKENTDALFELIDQCFSEELESELKFLEPIITEVFDQLDIDKLSDAIDVLTFANSFKELAETRTNAEKIDTISKFLKDYDLSENKDEEDAILALLNRKEPGLKKLIEKKNPSWIPEKYIKSLK